MSAASVVAAPAFAAGDKDPDGLKKIKFPPFLKPAIEKAYSRYAEWKGSDETVVFPIISDLHAEGEPKMKAPVTRLDWYDAKIHLLLARAVARRFNSDFIADLGDFGMDRWQKGGLPPWKEHMSPRMDLQYRLYRGEKVPVLFAPGNHDFGHPKKTITLKEWGECFNLRQKRERAGATELSANGDYGYLDLDAKKTRVVFMDTSETAPMGKGITASQVEWLGETARTTPAGWRLVVVSHIPLHRSLGRMPSESFDIPDGVGFAESRDILEKFAASRSMPVYTFAGHSHSDLEVEEKGVIYAISQSYGTAPWQRITPDARYTLVDRASTVIVDMVAIKPKNGEAKIFRVGAGGEKLDRDLVRGINRGAASWVYSSNRLRVNVPGVTARTSFKVGAGEAKAKNMTSEVRDGVRFVWIDNAGGEVTEAQRNFFNREAAKREPVALVLSVPVFVAGLSLDEAPSAHVAWKMPPDHPEINVRVGWLGGGHSYQTFYFRWNIFTAPRMVGIFAAYRDKSFVASDYGVVECVAPEDKGLEVVVNGY
jgi:hypothetical protein